jgi:hypothetical protein
VCTLTTGEGRKCYTNKKSQSSDWLLKEVVDLWVYTALLNFVFLSTSAR